MTPRPALPKQVSNTPEDSRQEFHNALESKVPVWVFLLVVGSLGTLLSILFGQINSIKDNELKELQKRTTVLETKFDLCQTASEKNQEDVHKRLSDLEMKSISRQDLPKESP